MLGQRRRRWTNIKTAVCELLVCAGLLSHIARIQRLYCGPAGGRGGRARHTVLPPGGGGRRAWLGWAGSLSKE